MLKKVHIYLEQLLFDMEYFQEMAYTQILVCSRHTYITWRKILQAWTC